MNTTKKIMMSVPALVAAGMIFLAGCQKDANPLTPQNGSSAITGSDNGSDRFGHSPVFPVNSHPFFRSYGQWAAEWWKWNLQFDCAHFPLNDVDGSLQNQDQHGLVYFLSGGHFNTPVTRNVTIPSFRSIFFSPITLESDDTTGMAASGQSLKDFLTAGAAGPVDGVDILTCTLDGNNIVSNLFDYRAHSSVFYFKANADLATCFDNIITGSPQPFVSDGYWIMLKPLSHGQHTLHFTGGISGPGLVIDVTYNITQQ